ncbi:uncharacterized protein LOC133891683 [Phragmites australis]|uniref:uncharacterized protein LOC133891683 n=1 Tax=Phragmites australis TaxID=29695 RepID=UPI002D78F85B|nr:uncharacterized protein LOC133891683 [Phragmites australis]
MGSEQEVAAAAAVTEEVAARVRSLVRSLLRPGSLLGVVEAADAAADGARRGLAEMSRENVTLRREDVEELAVAAAAGTLSVLVHFYKGSLNLPRGVVEAEITKAVAAAGALVGAMTSSSANNSAFRYFVLAFCMVVAVLSASYFVYPLSAM